MKASGSPKNRHTRIVAVTLSTLLPGRRATRDGHSPIASSPKASGSGR